MTTETSDDDNVKRMRQLLYSNPIAIQTNALLRFYQVMCIDIGLVLVFSILSLKSKSALCINGKFNTQFSLCLFCKMSSIVCMHQLVGHSKCYAKFHAIIVGTQYYYMWLLQNNWLSSMKSRPSVCDFNIYKYFYASLCLCRCPHTSRSFVRICVFVCTFGLWFAEPKWNEQTIPVELLKWNAS